MDAVAPKQEIRIDAKRIMALMDLRGIDAHKMADRMGMHYNGVQKILKNESTSINGLEKLCAALQCHPFDLIVAEGYPPPFSEARVSR